LFGTPLAPRVGRPYVVAGTNGLAAVRCWYGAMIEVTVVSVIVPKVFCKFLLQTTPLEPVAYPGILFGLFNKFS